MCDQKHENVVCQMSAILSVLDVLPFINQIVDELVNAINNPCYYVS